MSEELCDVHAHFLTDFYLEQAAVAGHLTPDGMPGWPVWTAAAHLALMDEHHISRSLLSISSPGVHFGDDAAARVLARKVNEFAADAAQQRPDRFGFFAALPLPDVDGALQEAAYALDQLGADGVAVETNAHGQYLGDERLAVLWAELDRHRAVVFVHPTSPPNWPQVSLGRPRPMLEFMFETTRSVTDLIFAGILDRFPQVRLIIPHGGATLPLLGERIELFRTVFTDDPQTPTITRASTRQLLQRLWYDTAGTPFPVQVPALAAAVGVERLLYGSDFCFTPASGVAAQILAIDSAEPPVGGGSWRQLTTANATALLRGNRRRTDTEPV